MDDTTNITKNHILESLSLNTSPETSTANEENLICCFCDHTEKNNKGTENKTILRHLYNEHRLVISDVQEISELQEYLKFWKNEFKG